MWISLAVCANDYSPLYSVDVPWHCVVSSSYVCVCVHSVQCTMRSIHVLVRERMFVLKSE